MGQKSSKQPPVDSRYLAPQKLRNFNEVDLRKLRRLIKDRKLAPCCPGVDSESRELEECPICFLKYPSLNRAVCCHKPICTECFLQVKALKAGHCPMCPYCKADFSIYFHGPATAEQRRKSEAEDNEQALALEKSRKGEQQQSPHAETQQLFEVPSCVAPCEQATQSAAASLVKQPPQVVRGTLTDCTALQTVDTGMDLWDFLPHHLFMAEAIQSEGDLDDIMHPNQFTASTSSTPGPHDSCRSSSVPLPSQLRTGVHAAQQASRASTGSALSLADSVQPGVLTGVVVGHSTGWQHPPEVPPTSQGGAGLQIQGSHVAGASAHSTAASASNSRSRMPSSSSQSDGIVHLSVKSADTQPSLHSSTPSTVASAQSSSTGCPQLDSPHKLSAISSGCIPWDLSLSSPAKKTSRVQVGAGDTLAGFLQEQAKAPNVEAQAIRLQPASGTHDLFVGMVTTDFTLVPPAGQQHSNSSCQTEAQSNPSQSQNSSPACLLPTAASSSVGVLGKRPGCMAADSQQELGVGQVAQGSVEPSGDDLSGGAVMLQNPDGSVQYVVLTSDEQRAVQLSMQAKRNKEAGTAETSTYHVECSPEDEAVRAAIAEGDAILQRLYLVPQDVQQRPVGASCAGLDASDTADRSTSSQSADPMLRRMEESDAKLRALYSSS